MILNKKIAVIIYGAPGSGKGTQAELLSKELGLFHFDTGDYLRSIFYGAGKLTKELIKERKINEAGELNSPTWILKIVNERTKHLAELGQSVVYSGSPRTVFETFGDKNHQGLLKLLEKIYKKNNIYIFVLDIPDETSIKRNSHRIGCSVCKTPLLDAKLKLCPFCGGKIEHRKDDKKNIIIDRLKEYHQRTEPIFKEIKAKKYNIFKIDGTPAPYKIHEQIMEHFK